MASDGQIVFEVTADGKKAIADIKDITNNIQQESKKWDKSVKESTDSMDSSFSSLVKKLSVAAIGAGIANGLKNLASTSLEAASALEEVQNVVDVTFGSGAGKIDSWAKNAGDQFGLTETQAKKFASTLGAMMKSSGMAGDEIVDMSTDLAGLAADMASFYNLDFDTAFQKIRSGISGETEPLKQLGINMSVANLNAYALQQGLEKTFDQMTQGEQTMLRYQYLMSATADAQGDFARTSDGYANSVRRVETAIESINTMIGSFLIGPAADALTWVADFLTAITAKPKTTIVDDFNSIGIETEKKLADIQKIKDEADALAGVLETIFGTKNEDTGEFEGGKESAEILAKLGVKSDEAKKYLEGLGFSTEEITEKQESWLETCRRLVKTIPGLSSIINTETGEVEGGVQAIYDYIDAWEKGQKKLAYMRAHEQKGQLLEDAFSDLPGLQLDKDLAAYRIKKYFNEVREIYKKYGQGLAFDKQGKVDTSWYRNATAEEKKALDEFAKAVNDSGLAKAYREASDVYDARKEAYETAKEMYEEEGKFIETLEGDIESLTDTTDAWLNVVGKTTDQIKELTDAALTALDDLGNYYEKMLTNTEKAVNSTIDGFKKIEDTAGKTKKKISDLIESQAGYEIGSADWKKVQAQIDELNESLINRDNMYSALESQKKFIDEYMANLQKAQAMGLSNELLAMLSDGTEESAQFLNALVNDTTGKSAKEIDELYNTIQKKKKELSKELTNQQLTVDDTYESLQQKAKEAVAALDLEDEASKNSGKTIAGIAAGIKAHVPEVASAVDEIIAQLDRLAGYGISYDFGTGTGTGSVFIPHNYVLEGGGVDGDFAVGLDRVPFDGFLASLHEGESILTAEEARVWRRFKEGTGTDYDALGGVMRDNIKPGGNVYLDGRVVGSVISDQQGKTFRQLQRSGWQG